MSAAQEFKAQLAVYPSNQFYVDEHVLERVAAHHHLDLHDILQRLRTGKYDAVMPNDSRNTSLSGVDSYKVFITKSTSVIYCVVVYLPDTIDKPLIKTVYQDDRTAQERLNP